MSGSGPLSRLTADWGLGRKMASLLLVMLVVFGLNVGSIYVYQQQTTAAQAKAEVASEQSVLSQRMAFYAALRAQERANGTQLRSAIETYERNLVVLANGTDAAGNGTVDAESATSFGPLPVAARDDLDRQQRIWRNYSYHARVVARERPYNPEFTSAAEYVREHAGDLSERTGAIARVYEQRGNRSAYAAELALVGRLEVHSQSIATLVLRLSRSSDRFGGNVYLENQLRQHVARYEELLTTLEDGGTYRGMTVEPAPDSVRTEIDRVRQLWPTYREQARTVAQEDHLDSQFWTSLQYIEVHSDDLDRASRDVSTTMARIVQQKQQRLQLLIGGLLVFNVVVVLGGIVWVRRRVTTPLEVLTERATRIADEELDVDLPETTRGDEIGRLLTAFGRMRDNLRSLIDDLAFVDQLVEQSGVGLVAYTADGHVEYANPAYADLLGMDRDAVESAAVWELNPEIDPDQFDRYWASFDENETRRTETIHERADGTQFPVEVTSTRVGIDEQTYHVATIEDITARKDRDQRIAVLNRVLRHNLRNELSVILSGIDYARVRYPDDENDQPLENARAATERMRHISEKAKMVEETLTRPEETVSPMPLAGLVAESVTPVRQRFPRADVSVDVPDEVWIEADEFLPVAAEEVLANAIEHHDRDEPTVEVTATADEDRVELAFADDGPGIPETEYEVFTMNDSITQLSHGSGLGLWTVNWIVQHCGGEIRIDHRDPRGTVVTFSLVRADRPDREPPDASESADSGDDTAESPVDTTTD